MGDLLERNNGSSSTRGRDGLVGGSGSTGNKVPSQYENSLALQEEFNSNPSTGNYGLSYAEEFTDLSISQSRLSNELGELSRDPNSSRRNFDLGSLGVNLPLNNNEADAFSFHPWSRPSSPTISNLSSSQSQLQSQSNINNPYEPYPISSSSSISISSSNSVLSHPSASLSNQEHIWSRSNQEQQHQQQLALHQRSIQEQSLALQQRQQREQLQLQLQQQDEWYQQEAFQRQQQQQQQQEAFRLQRRIESNRSYSIGSNSNQSNPYDYPTSPNSYLPNTSPYSFSNPSPRPSIHSPSLHRESPIFNSNSSIHERNSSSDASSYSLERDGSQFHIRSQSLSQSQDDRRIPPLPLPSAAIRHQLPFPASSNSPWNNVVEQDYPNYLLPQHRNMLSPTPPPLMTSNSQSRIGTPVLPQLLNRFPSNVSPNLSAFPSSNSSSNNLLSTSTSTSRSSQNQQNSINKPRIPVQTLRSGLPVAPDRSAHAMWTGNVPGDTTLEELEKFFYNRPGPKSPSNNGPSDSTTPQDLILESSGVESIHLISRSNCAFINYLTSAHLQHAIATTNGLPLRPLDRRCKPLLCRVRQREDDAKSGVGAQRGGGLHKGYIAALIGNTASSNVTVEGEQAAEDDGEDDEEESNGSTSSSSLMRHFPKRYFILKSHNNEELEKSVETGLWCTQSHNESVLDQAYRTAKDGVYFVFSANKSGEWFGYARMAGPIGSSNEWSPDTSTLNVTPQTLSGETSVNPGNSREKSLEAINTVNSTIVVENETKEVVGEPIEFAGKPFKVEWIKVQKIQFVRTRHILNSFNSSREVKISRDGTEIEPIAGNSLLQEFWSTSLPSSMNMLPRSTFPIRNISRTISGSSPSLNLDYNAAGGRLQ